MQLAADETTVRLGHEIIHLRPTLRAALRLERRHGGFSNIARAVADENLTVIADVIRECADVRSGIPDLLCEVGAEGMHVRLGALVAPILRHVATLAGHDPDQPASEGGGHAEGERITFAEHHARLYRIATGWLGWEPETAWNATIAEIIEAQCGRVELLNALFAAKGNGDACNVGMPDNDRDEAGWAALKAIAAAGGNKAA